MRSLSRSSGSTAAAVDGQIRVVVSLCRLGMRLWLGPVQSHFRPAERRPSTPPHPGQAAGLSSASCRHASSRVGWVRKVSRRGAPCDAGGSLPPGLCLVRVIRGVCPPPGVSSASGKPWYTLHLERSVVRAGSSRGAPLPVFRSRDSVGTRPCSASAPGGSVTVAGTGSPGYCGRGGRFSPGSTR